MIYSLAISALALCTAADAAGVRSLAEASRTSASASTSQAFRARALLDSDADAPFGIVFFTDPPADEDTPPAAPVDTTVVEDEPEVAPPTPAPNEESVTAALAPAPVDEDLDAELQAVDSGAPLGADPPVAFQPGTNALPDGFSAGPPPEVSPFVLPDGLTPAPVAQDGASPGVAVSPTDPSQDIPVDGLPAAGQQDDASASGGAAVVASSAAAVALCAAALLL